MNYIENNLALSRALEFASFIMPQAKYILEQGIWVTPFHSQRYINMLHISYGVYQSS